MSTNTGAVSDRARVRPSIELQIDPIPPENLDACARVLARIAVEKTMKELWFLASLDSGPTTGDDAANPHKAAPPSVDAPNGAKEQVK